jgi:hypothetical protein
VIAERIYKKSCLEPVAKANTRLFNWCAVRQFTITVE